MYTISTVIKVEVLIICSRYPGWKDDPVKETIRGKNWRKMYTKQQGFYTKLCLNIDL
jgi:hypothetical protein